MNREMELKLQAYLDGELSRRETGRVAAWLESNPEAQAMLAELKMTKGFLSGNEPELTLPESREFYWSKIERQIERLEQQPAPNPIWEQLLAWRKYLVPAAGIAVAVLLALAVPPADRLATVENLSEETGSFSFRAPSENMFVVWVYEKNNSSASEAEPLDEDDVTVQ